LIKDRLFYNRFDLAVVRIIFEVELGISSLHRIYNSLSA